MPRVMITLDREEERALYDLALRERRKPPQQIAFLLRRWLEDNDLLPPATPAAAMAPGPRPATTGPARPQAVQREA